MDGIADMFEEFAGWEQQEFDFQYAAEQTRMRTLTTKAETERLRYRWLRSIPSKRDEIRAYRSKQVTQYVSNRLRDDPAWAAQHRAKRAAAEAKRREAKRQMAKAA